MPTSGAVELRRGQSTTVSGIFFHRGCEDTLVSPGPGCQAPQPSDPQFPLTEVRLTLGQGDRTWVLGTADAADRDHSYAISWTVTVPADATPGSAELTAGTASLDVKLT